MKTTLLGTNSNGFVLNTNSIVGVGPIRIARNEENKLCARLEVWVNNKTEMFSFNWVLAEAEYEVTTVPFLKFFKRTTSTLIKYSKEEQEKMPYYADAFANREQIIADMTEKDNK